MINGIINVYKEAGFTSFDVVAKLRGITRIRKIGHTGTLDPDATGVLPVCIGSATKLCDMLTDKTKEYEATFILGITTDTQDISGKIMSTNMKELDSILKSGKQAVESVISLFVGKQQQIPPMYSAIKINGQKLYDLARAGKEVERQPRDIEIHYINIESIDEAESNLISGKTFEIKIRVGCSKGTYIRTLCYDIGQKLGCGATMTKLVRTRSGQFKIEDALTLDQIEQIVKKNNAAQASDATLASGAEQVTLALEDIVVPVDKVFEEYETVTVEGEAEKRVLNGNFIKHDYCGDKIRVYLSDDSFAAVYEYSKEHRNYSPYKMFLK